MLNFSWRLVSWAYPSEGRCFIRLDSGFGRQGAEGQYACGYEQARGDGKRSAVSGDQPDTFGKAVLLGTAGDSRGDAGQKGQTKSDTDLLLNQGDHATSSQHRSPEIEAPGVAVSFDEVSAAKENEYPDRDVDEEDPPPAERAGKDAAKQQANYDPEAGHCTVEGQRCVPGFAI